jgi:S-adenosylmethionine hydrolase
MSDQSGAAGHGMLTAAQRAEIEKLIADARTTSRDQPQPADLSKSQERQVQILIWKILGIVASALVAAAIPVVKFYIDSRTEPGGLTALQKQGEKIIADLRTSTSQTTPPLVGLITDFGTGSYYLGKFRGAVYSSVPNARLIDISHEINEFDVSEASWILYNAAKTFPEGSAFLGIVNPGADLRYSYLVVTKKPHFYFVGAGRQLFDHVVAHFGLEEAYVVPVNSDDDTFGIETFIPVVKSLLLHHSVQYLKDNNLISTAPFAYSPTLPSAVHPAVTGGGRASGFICAIDRWGNLQTNISPAALSLGRTYRVKVGAKLLRSFVFAKSYSDGQGSAGVLIAQDEWIQVAVFRGSASALFQVDRPEAAVEITEDGS